MKRFWSTLALLLALLAPAPAGAEPWRAFPFTLRDLTGKTHSLAEYRGKVVVLEFFASWCPTCAASVRGLNMIAKKYADRVVVVAVATNEDDPHGLPEFVEQLKPEYTILADDTDRVGRQYRVIAFPTYFIIDPKGTVRASQDGAVEWNDPRNQKRLESLFDTPYRAPEEAPMPVTTVSIAPALR